MKKTSTEMEKKVQEFLKDTSLSKTNCVEYVIKNINSPNDDFAISAIVGINQIFYQVFKTNEEFFRSETGPLKACFESAWKSLLSVLEKCKPSADLAFPTLIKWIELETIHGSTEDNYKFPEERLELLVGVLCGDGKLEAQIKAMVEQMEKFDDLNFYTAKVLWKISDKYSKPASDQSITNYLGLVKAIRVKDKLTSDQELSTFGDLQNFPFNFQELRKYFQYAWVNFLRASLPEKLYIQVLVNLNDKKIALFKNPCLMADFLIESYNKGGAVALLALDGLFTLMHKYNLELPDFYTRLYALFKPEIFYQRYRARFFFLADVFLSSSHLPAYLVAAFAKKMSRLCLVAPAYSQLHVIPFVGNLIIRHSALSRMVHCQEVEDLSTDPFEENETDPAKSRAIESSLWELKSLQSHWFHKAAAKANIINSAFPKIEWNFSDVLEEGYPQLFEKAVKEKYKGSIPTTNYHKPKGILKHADDKLSSCWKLDN